MESKYFISLLPYPEGWSTSLGNIPKTVSEFITRLLGTVELFREHAVGNVMLKMHKTSLKYLSSQIVLASRLHTPSDIVHNSPDEPAPEDAVREVFFAG